jgi:hypothetical protein
MADCTIHLLSLRSGIAPDKVVSHLRVNANQKILITGVPHGWVHKPHKLDVDKLLSHGWHLFILTTASSQPLQLDSGIEAQLQINVTIPEEQWNQLVEPTANKSHNIPQLPSKWLEQSTGDLHIPKEHVASQTTPNPPPGTLILDPPMARFLSTALPKPVQQKPVSLFNLFKYKNNDSAIHEQYMQDFKRSFGNSAGAYVKFMGPVGPLIDNISENQSQQQEQHGDDGGSWQEANLTHYDSIFHYAYMLSTDVYQGLNKDKVRGLEDTCILLVSEVEMLHKD